jgi:hypothetical protein
MFYGLDFCWQSHRNLAIEELLELQFFVVGFAFFIAKMYSTPLKTLIAPKLCNLNI